VALLKAQAVAGWAYGAISAATAQVLEPHSPVVGRKATTYTSAVVVGFGGCDACGLLRVL
jgi:hypothetical protein